MLNLYKHHGFSIKDLYQMQAEKGYRRADGLEAGYKFIQEHVPEHWGVESFMWVMSQCPRDYLAVVTLEDAVMNDMIEAYNLAAIGVEGQNFRKECIRPGVAAESAHEPPSKRKL